MRKHEGKMLCHLPGSYSRETFETVIFVGQSESSWRFHGPLRTKSVQPRMFAWTPSSVFADRLTEKFEPSSEILFLQRVEFHKGAYLKKKKSKDQMNI